MLKQLSLNQMCFSLLSSSFFLFGGKKVSNQYNGQVSIMAKSLNVFVMIEDVPIKIMKCNETIKFCKQFTLFGKECVCMYVYTCTHIYIHILKIPVVAGKKHLQPSNNMLHIVLGT